MAEVEYVVDDAGVATITLNRPERKNAFTDTMIDALARALTAARGDDDVRALVLTGAGGAFCSGVDLAKYSGVAPSPLDRKRNLQDHVHRVALAFEDLDKPIIAAVPGVAVGAGMDIALMCDIRIAAESARFSEAYIHVGLIPGNGGCYYLPKIVGTERALEMLLTGDFVDAEVALRLGLVSRVVPDSDLPTAASELAQRIAAAPPVAVRMIKRAVYQSQRTDLRTALDMVSSHLAVVASTEDSAEALRAFRERRDARFGGR